MTPAPPPTGLQIPAATPLHEVQAALAWLGLEISPVRRSRVLDVRPLRPAHANAGRRPEEAPA